MRLPNLQECARSSGASRSLLVCRRIVMGHFRKHCISFVVSSRCNLDCIYCYIPHWGSRVRPEDRVLDLDFAIAGMKEFFSWAPVPAIRFFSAGEATTAFGRMVEIH